METLIKTVDLSVADEPEDGLAIGSLAGRWQIEHELGRGGMGIVYAVVHADIGKRAALKILHRKLFSSSSHRDRTLTEARVVNQIDHPNIVDIFDTGTLPDGRSYIVMERLDGCSLAEHAARTKVLPDNAITILYQVCDALEAAHAVGVLHRDLKLDNVFLVDESGHRIKLLDWGIAKIIAQQVSTTREGTLAGTPQYVSPEQARGLTLTPKSDVYSLGVMAYQLFLEALPFDGDSAVEVLAMHLHAAPPPPRELWPDIPRPLEALLLAMLAKQPDDRPSLAEVSRRLEEIQGELVNRRGPAWEQIVNEAPAIQVPRAPRWIAPAKTVPSDISATSGRWRYALGVASLAALALLIAFTRDEEPSGARADRALVESGDPATAEPAPELLAPPPSPAVERTVERTVEQALPSQATHDVAAAHADALAPTNAPATKPPASRTPHAPSVATKPPAPVSPPTSRTAPTIAQPPQPARPSPSTAPPSQPAQPSQPAPPAVPSADAVVAKYTALGQKLADAPRQRELSALWSRYRRLHIQEALVTADKRAQAVQLLDQLASELAARR
jgi:serine/threonine-protein kinase